MLLKILAGFAVAAAIFMIIWCLRGMLLTPVRRNKNQSITVVMKVREDSDDLENTVGGLMWLIENGTLPAGLVLVDGGMSPETRHAADIMAADLGIDICAPDEIITLI